MIRMIFIAAIISFSIQQTVSLPVDELEVPELQETIDEKVKADADDYKMEEINKLAIPDEYEYTRLKRLERQAETEAKEKPAPAPPQPQPAHIEQGAPAASAANLQLTISFQKHIAVLGIALSVLYTMKEYLCV